MSEERYHEDEHESGIKTPKQLIIVVAAAIIVPVIVIIMLTQFVSLESKQSPGSDAYAASAVAARIAPVASDAVFDASAVVVPKTGQQVFEAQCTTAIPRACSARPSSATPPPGPRAWPRATTRC